MTSKTKKTQKKRKNITYVAKPLPAEGFVREPTVLAALGICRSTRLNWTKEGKIPPGKLLSPRCRVWHVDEIRQLIDELGNAA